MKTIITSVIIALSISACQIGSVNQCKIHKYVQQLSDGHFAGCFRYN
jgi:hypothetical protein